MKWTDSRLLTLGSTSAIGLFALLNVEVSSFGATRDEAVANLKEAVELYFEGSQG